MGRSRWWASPSCSRGGAADELNEVIQIEESAKDSKARKKFHAAVERLRNDDIRHVIFFVWDRTTRNFTDHEILEALIRRDEIVLHVASDRWMLSVDSDEGDWMKAEISTFVANSCSRTLSRRARQGQDANAAAGWYPTRPPPGDRKRDVNVDGSVKDRGGTIEQRLGGRALLHRMRDLRVREGLSLGAIGKRVVEDGTWFAAGQRRKSVNAGHVQRMLTDPFYVGTFNWRGKDYVGKHEPMFTKPEWAEHQPTFGRKAAYGARAEYEAAFGGWMTCGECGCRITAEVHKKPSGRTFIYYRCANGRRAHDKLVRPTQPDVVEQLGSAVDDIHITPDFAALLAEELNKTTRDVRERRRREQAQFRQQLEATQADEDALTDKLLKRVIDDDTHQRQLVRIRQRRADLLTRIEETHDQLDDKLLVTASRVLDLAKRAKNLWSVQNLAEKRALSTSRHARRNARKRRLAPSDVRISNCSGRPGGRRTPHLSTVRCDTGCSGDLVERVGHEPLLPVGDCYRARILLPRASCVTSASFSASSSGGMYIPKRPRSPFFSPYHPPMGLLFERLV